MSFGQLVIGPPGSGKTTYCRGMYEYLTGIGRRVCVVNLDPANDTLPYPCAIDLKELITMEEVMETFQLGPNGGLMYCIEYLEKNLSWLKKKIEEHKDAYFLFDLPGQVELYTHHQGMKKIVQKLTCKWGMRVRSTSRHQLGGHAYLLTCVNLIDSHHCSDPSKFLSVLLISLCTMTQLELPHVNILSKMDLIEMYGELEFGLEFYTDVLDLSYILPRLKQTSNPQHPLTKKFSRLNAAIADLVETYNLVSFIPLDIQNQEMLINAVKLVDKANGYVYVQQVSTNTGLGAAGSTTKGQSDQTAAAAAIAFNQRMMNTAHKSDLDELRLPDIQERYLPRTTQDHPRVTTSTISQTTTTPTSR